MSSTVPAAALLRRLELRLGRLLVPGRLQGGNPGVRLGPGSEAEEVSRYRPGEDDVRRIDWNVTARTGEVHVWRSRAEHELSTWVLVDETPSMAFGTVASEKSEVARSVAAAVGLLTDAPGNRTGVLRVRADGLVWDRALPGRRLAHRVLSAPEPPREGGASPTLAEALRALTSSRPRPGMRVVVSDFVEPDGRSERPFPWERALRRLAARNQVVVVEVVDPRELSLPDVGPVVLEDPETGHRCEVWTSLPGLREDYARLAEDHRRNVGAAVKASGAQHVVLRTDHDWLRELARAVRRRRTHPTPTRRTR